MAEVDFKTIMIQAIVVGLFIVAMISFVYQFSIDNGANETILDDSVFNQTFNALKQNLSNSQSESINQSLNQDKSNPIAIFEFLSEAIVGTVKVFKGLFSDMYNVTFGLIMTKLGIDPIVLYSIVSIILITLVFLGWRSWKRG